MKRLVMLAVMLTVAGLMLAGTAISAGLQDTVKGFFGGADKSRASIATSALSEADMSGGLKEALSVGVKKAIELLGQDGGFLHDKQVRIPMPGALSSVEKLLRQTGQKKVADEFIATLNHAAEQAVPQAAGIMGDAVKQMSVQDAKTILSGPDDAATRYFRDQTQGSLSMAMLPIVQQATGKVGLTKSYKKLVDSTGGMMGGLVDKKSLDLDHYVTQKTLDGLFLKIAAEEKNIRANPTARTTDLLKKIFGAVKP